MGESSRIKVNYKSKIISVEVDGSPRDPTKFVLKLADLRHNFPKANNLSYTENNILNLLRVEGDCLKLNPDVDTYDIQFVEGKENNNCF